MRKIRRFPSASAGALAFAVAVSFVAGVSGVVLAAPSSAADRDGGVQGDLRQDSGAQATSSPIAKGDGGAPIAKSNQFDGGAD